MSAAASEAHGTRLMLELFVMFGGAKLLAELFTRLRQPGVVGEILAGVLIGPQVLRLVAPSETSQVLAELGVIFLLFNVGLETKPASIFKVGPTALLVAVLGVALPLAGGYALMRAWGSSGIEALFTGTALVATSVGITARVLGDLGLLDALAARIILGAAVIDDILGLLVLAAVSSAAQGHVDLAGIAFTQMVRKGAPAGYGGFTSNVDMKTGAPAFGTPEYMKAVIAGGQLARRYGFPYRTSNTNAANTVDAQAAYESVFSLWGVVEGGGNFVMHSAGWTEGGLTASFEKFILDVDLLQMVAEFLRPLDVSEDALALDAIRDVGPGGHFFGTAHTLARYENAFYSPLISDWRNNETWVEAGKPTAFERANRIYKETLAHYERPPLDPAVEEELDAFVARRKAEGGVPTDF